MKEVGKGTGENRLARLQGLDHFRRKFLLFRKKVSKKEKKSYFLKNEKKIQLSEPL